MLKPLTTLLLAVFASMASTAAMGQSSDYPTRPIHLIGPFAAGGSGDLIARLTAAYLNKAWGQSVIVENRPAGGATVGSNDVKRATPDGYTLLMGYDAITNFSLFIKDNTFDATKDVVPISLVARYPLAMLMNTAVPAKTLPELISYAKANPGKLNYATLLNSPGHLYGLLFMKRAGVDLTLIPYPSAASMTQAVLADESQVTLSLYGSFIGGIKDGKIKAIGVTQPQRMQLIPDVPTFAESGVNLNASVWFGLFAPVGTPQPIIAKIAAATKEMVKQPDVIEQAGRLQIELVGSTPEELAKVVAEDTVTRAEAAKIGNIQPQ
jgi:tripartite-type tricarboxylate transporter receptor subunit TctC